MKVKQKDICRKRRSGDDWLLQEMWRRGRKERGEKQEKKKWKLILEREVKQNGKEI